MIFVQQIQVENKLNDTLNTSEISKYYTKSDTSNLLILKQNVLSNSSGDGIELLSSNNIRTNGSDGIDITMYMNMSDTNDAKNNNIKIRFNIKKSYW